MKLFDKLFCCHDWAIVTSTEYEEFFVHLLKCKKCGKLVKKIV